MSVHTDRQTTMRDSQVFPLSAACCIAHESSHHHCKRKPEAGAYTPFTMAAILADCAIQRVSSPQICTAEDVLRLSFPLFVFTLNITPILLAIILLLIGFLLLLGFLLIG